jgi:ABC-2 type transport system permease protein
MTDLTIDPDPPPGPPQGAPSSRSATDLAMPTPPSGWRPRLRWALADSATVVRRNLDHLRAQPGEVVGELAFPAIMVVLFGYVLGSAIRVPGGGNYRMYLMPGLFAMTAVTGGISTMMAVAMDTGRGVMDRFRSMPMARSAVLAGQTGADIILGLFAMVVMIGVGYLVGWHPTNGPAAALGAVGLLIAFRYAVSWGGTWLGSTLSEETADKLIPLVFPITMLSNAFVPTANMPTWLRLIADWNPVSALVSACRELFMGASSLPSHTAVALPLRHPVVTTVIWIVVLLIGFGSLSVRRFQAVKA